MCDLYVNKLPTVFIKHECGLRQSGTITRQCILDPSREQGAGSSLLLVGVTSARCYAVVVNQLSTDLGKVPTHLTSHLMILT